jgi:hypothetical protein
MCLLREFWTTYRTSDLQNRINAPQFEQILTSLKRKFVFSHSLGRKRTLLNFGRPPYWLDRRSCILDQCCVFAAFHATSSKAIG